MITAAVFRLVVLLFVVVLDVASREERRNTFLNATGTVALMRMQGREEEGFADAGGYGAVADSPLPPGALGSARKRLNALRLPWDQGHETLCFGRSRALADTLPLVLKMRPEQFKKIFRYQLEHEPALDAGGVAREYCSLVAEQLVAGGFFARSDVNGIVYYSITPHPDPTGDGCLNHYAFAGRWLGKALLDGHTVPLRLAEPLYAALLGHVRQPRMEDLALFDAQMHRELTALLAMDPAEVAGLDLEFQVSFDLSWRGRGVVTVPLDPEEKQVEELISGNFFSSGSSGSSPAKQSPREVTGANVAEVPVHSTFSVHRSGTANAHALSTWRSAGGGDSRASLYKQSYF